MSIVVEKFDACYLRSVKSELMYLFKLFSLKFETVNENCSTAVAYSDIVRSGLQASHMAMESLFVIDFKLDFTCLDIREVCHFVAS